MAYCTLDDLKARYGEESLLLLSNKDDINATTINLAVVNQAIADADAEINMYLAARHTLPLDKIPLPLVKASCILTYANLNSKKPKEAPELVDADRQRAILAKVSEGKLSLGLSLTNEEATLANTVQISEGRNDFKERY